MRVYTYFGANEYNCSIYGEGNYSQCVNGASTGPLANTGYDIIIPVSLAAAIMIAGAILIIRRVFKKKLLNQ